MTAKTYARVVNAIVAEVFAPPTVGGAQVAIDRCFHADVAAQFIECPAGTLAGATYSGGVFTNPAPGPDPDPPAAQLPKLTPMQFYLAFTPHERIAIKGSNDPVIKEFWATYQLAVQTNTPIDPNLASVQEGLAALLAASIVADESRIAAIKSGTPQ